MGASVQASDPLRIHTGMGGHTMRANNVKEGMGQMFHRKCSGTGHIERGRRSWIKCKRVRKSLKKKNVQKRKMGICVTISGESEEWTQMQANGAKGG